MILFHADLGRRIPCGYHNAMVAPIPACQSILPVNYVPPWSQSFQESITYLIHSAQGSLSGIDSLLAAALQLLSIASPASLTSFPDLLLLLLCAGCPLVCFVLNHMSVHLCNCRSRRRSAGFCRLDALQPTKLSGATFWMHAMGL